MSRCSSRTTIVLHFKILLLFSIVILKTIINRKFLRSWIKIYEIILFLKYYLILNCHFKNNYQSEILEVLNWIYKITLLSTNWILNSTNKLSLHWLWIISNVLTLKWDELIWKKHWKKAFIKQFIIQSSKCDNGTLFLDGLFFENRHLGSEKELNYDTKNKQKQTHFSVPNV